MNRYFKTSDAKNFAFYKVPKALFEEKYKSVSTDAKMLDGLQQGDTGGTRGHFRRGVE